MIMMLMMFMRTQCKVSTKSNAAWHRAHLPCGSDPSHCWWSLFSSCDFMLMMIILTVAFLYIPQFTLPSCCWWSCHDQIIPQFTFKNRLQCWKRSCWGMTAMTTFAVRLVIYTDDVDSLGWWPRKQSYWYKLIFQERDLDCQELLCPLGWQWNSVTEECSLKRGD